MSIFDRISSKGESSSQLLDVTLGILEAEDFSSMSKSVNGYSSKNTTVQVVYLTPDCFEEIRVSIGYNFGKGLNVILRKYIEHLVVINYEILETHHTIEFPVKAISSGGPKEYRERFNAVAERIMQQVEELEKAPLK